MAKKTTGAAAFTAAPPRQNYCRELYLRSEDMLTGTSEKESWQQCEQRLVGQLDLLLAFTEKVCGLLQLKPASKATKRKASCRLTVRGDQSYDLVATPFGRSRGLGENDSLTVELYQNFCTEANGEKRARARVLTVRVLPRVFGRLGGNPDLDPRLELHRCYRDRFAEHLGQLTRLATHWLKDPLQPIGGVADHCCICGRILTDATSRARGIGPECILWSGGFLLAGNLADRKDGKFIPVEPDVEAFEEFRDIPPLSV
jgi:hypothetical protein